MASKKRARNSGGVMVQIKCPRCKSKVDISEFKENGEDRIAVFCSQEACLYYKNPIVGIDRKESEVYISESILQTSFSEF